jgi:plasmid stabilization system protein ParE
MKSYRLTATAERHLKDIWRYSRDRWGETQADACLASIDA